MIRNSHPAHFVVWFEHAIRIPRIVSQAAVEGRKFHMSTVFHRGRLVFLLVISIFASPLVVSAQSPIPESLIDGTCIRSEARVRAATPDLAGDDWERAIAFVLRYEGSRLSIDSNGALVRYGINQAVHRSVNVRTLSRERAVELYRSIYWEGSGAALYDWPMNLIVFDTAVLFGRGVPARWVEAGHDTAQALILRRVESHMHSKFGTTYRRGWCNRLESLTGVVYSQ